MVETRARYKYWGKVYTFIFNFLNSEISTIIYS